MKVQIKKLNQEQIKILAAGAAFGFLDFLKNREIEFYKQLSKMRFKKK